MAFRMERMASVIRQVVSDCIANRLSDPRLARFITVTRVELSPDLSHANVYLSIMGTDAQAATSMKGMASARGLIQTQLARELDVRQCPALQFHLDKGLKIGAAILEKMDHLREGSAPDGPTNPPSDGSDDDPSDRGSRE